MKGTTAKDLRRLYTKLLQLTDGVEPISAASLAVKKEIKDTYLEFFVEDLLKNMKPPEALTQTPATPRRRKSTRKLPKGWRLGKSQHALDDIIAQIDAVIVHLSNKEHTANTISHLRTIKHVYQAYKDMDQMKRKHDVSSNAFNQHKTKLSLALQGTFYLSEKTATQVLPLNPQTGQLVRMNESGVHVVTNAYGIHFKFSSMDGSGLEGMVGSFPGIEYAVDSMNKLISGQGSPPTTLVTFSSQGKRFVALASETVEGKTLEDSLGRLAPKDLVGVTKGAIGEDPLDADGSLALWNKLKKMGVLTNEGHVLWANVPLPCAPKIDHIAEVEAEIKVQHVDAKKDNETYTVDAFNLGEMQEYKYSLLDNLWDLHAAAKECIHSVSSENYGYMVLLSLLTNPSDGKLDNYILRRECEGEEEAHGLWLTGIDNEEAFVDAVLALSTGHLVGVKQVLYFFPQMQKELHPNVKNTLVEIQPAVVVIEWLKDLSRKNTEYQSMLNEHILTREELDKLSLPIRLMPGTVEDIYNKLCIMKDLITNRERDNLSVTPFDLFEAVQPAAAMYYRKLSEECPSDPVRTLQHGFEMLFSPRTPLFEDYFGDDLDKMNILRYHFREEVVPAPMDPSSDTPDILNPEQKGKEHDCIPIKLQHIGTVAMLSRSDSLKSVLNEIPKWRDFVRDRTQLPKDALAQWMSSPNFFKFIKGVTQQGSTIEALYGANIQYIALHSCEGLDDIKLINLIQTCTEMSSVTLNQCHKVTEAAVYKMAIEGWMPEKTQLVLVRCALISERCQKEIEDSENITIVLVKEKHDEASAVASTTPTPRKRGRKSSLNQLISVTGDYHALQPVAEAILSTQKKEIDQEREWLDNAWNNLKQVLLQQELDAQQQRLDETSKHLQVRDLEATRWMLQAALSDYLSPSSNSKKLEIHINSIIKQVSDEHKSLSRDIREYHNNSSKRKEEDKTTIMMQEKEKALTIPSRVSSSKLSNLTMFFEQGVVVCKPTTPVEIRTKDVLHWLDCKVVSMKELLVKESAEAIIKGMKKNQEHQEAQREFLQRREQALRDRKTQYFLDSMELEERRQEMLKIKEEALKVQKALLQVAQEELERSRRQVEEEKIRMVRERERLDQAKAEMQKKTQKMKEIEAQAALDKEKAKQMAAMQAEIEAMRVEVEEKEKKRKAAEAELKELERAMKEKEAEIKRRLEEINKLSQSGKSGRLSAIATKKLLNQKMKAKKQAKKYKTQFKASRKEIDHIEKESAKAKIETQQQLQRVIRENKKLNQFVAEQEEATIPKLKAIELTVRAIKYLIAKEEEKQNDEQQKKEEESKKNTNDEDKEKVTERKLKAEYSLTSKSPSAADVIYGAMQTFPQSVDIQKISCVTIWKLTLNSQKAKEQLGRSGGLKHILSATKNHPKCVALHRKACGAVYQLCKFPDNRVRLVEDEGVQLILNSMEMFPEASSLQQYHARTLFMLANDGQGKLIIQYGGVQLLKDASKSHADKDAAYWATRTLDSLSLVENAKSNRKMVQMRRSLSSRTRHKRGW